MNTSFQFDVGSFRCIAIRDLADEVEGNFTSLYVDTGQHKIVVDPGLGSDCFPLTTDHGFMLDRLRDLSVTPTDADLVIYTRADIDHVCGGVDAAGKPALANARYVLLRKEWDFWVTSPERLRPDASYNEEFRRLCREVPPVRLGQLQDRLELVTAGEEIVPGVRMLGAPGHTPGHACISFLSGSDRMLFVGNLFYSPEEIVELHLGSYR